MVQALSFYGEALSHDPGHAKSLLSTARLHLAHNENEQVHALCVQLLRSDPDNEEASMMMAELMFRKVCAPPPFPPPPPPPPPTHLHPHTHAHERESPSLVEVSWWHSRSR